MKFTSALLAAVAVGALAAPMANASAATKKHPAAHHGVHHRAARHVVRERAENTGDAELLRQQVAQLQAEVASLHQEVNAQRQAEAATQARVTQVAQASSNQAPVSSEQPVTQAQVQAQIAQAVEAEHHKDHFDFKGITITPGGFLELAGIYRQHEEGADITSNWGGLPFPNAHTYGVSEGRFSARQSRVSFLAQGKPDKNVALAMYGEFDFLGAAQTANSNQTNSYQPRIRHLYATIDWNRGDSGWHFLAGQTWSLVTMNSKGITPRNEVTPIGPDAQYVPGFIFARQPQVRLTGDFADHHLWIAVSAENPQTVVGGATPPANVTNVINAGSGFFAGDVGATPAVNTLSLNGTPDFVGKVAYEGAIGGHNLHLEGFAISRTFTAHYNGGSNENKAGYGFGGGVLFQAVPSLLDVQFSGIAGKGIGRYGASSLPDVVFDANGNIHPIKEFALLAGATLHATKMLDIYAYAGEEQEHAERFGAYGLGLVAASDAGCYTEGGTCSGNTRRVRQITGGFWQKIYSGNFGRAQVGLQYSYSQRELFYATSAVAITDNGMPQASESVGLLSFRYYPF